MTKPTREEARERVPAAVRAGNWLFRWRNYAFPVTFFGLLFAGHPHYAGGSVEADRLLDAAGLAVALVGQGIRWAVLGLVSISRAGKGNRVHADRLFQGGLFAHSRNPLYVGNVLVFTGLLTVWNSWVGWIVALPAVLLTYYCIVRAEEAFLSERFGAEYRAYRARVRRFLPRARGLGATLRGQTFDWRRAVRKEYGATFAWMTAVVIVVAWERAANGAGDQVRANWAAYAAAWGVLLAGYVTVRFLKKTKRLRGR